ncbi:wall-associated receptor kinase 3-like [Salvia splendens]|uniref:wall-associated receptor kinase 3-like n=1 Tax=Salvia splendens TaxID=180675 RepID=UPI001C25A9AD|nr:wall-associated receptor kinase 3-like [Salvia splendens]
MVYNMHVMIMFILVSSTKLLPVFSSYNNFPIAAKSSCNDTCGNIRIPFPFGISKNCYLDDQFALTCNHTSFKLFSGPIEITDISIDGQITFLQSIAYQCYDSNGIQSSNFSEGIQLGSYFTVNNTANKFTMVGCSAIAAFEGTTIANQPYATAGASLCRLLEI